MNRADKRVLPAADHPHAEFSVRHILRFENLKIL
jgi:hypothetical protein